MLNYIFVGFGAAIGGVLRYWLANYTYKFFPESLPIGTLVVNAVGSFILGLIMFYFSDKNNRTAIKNFFNCWILWRFYNIFYFFL